MSNKHNVKRAKRIAELTGKTLVWPPKEVQYRLQLEERTTVTTVTAEVVPARPHMQSPKLNATKPVVRRVDPVWSERDIATLTGRGRGRTLSPAPHGRIVEAEVLAEIEISVRTGRMQLTSEQLAALLR